MEGVQRFLSGHKNYINSAAITAPVKPIADAVVKMPVARSGNSAGALTGTFTGTEEKTFEVEITDVVPTTPLVTAPTFKGVGTGEMTGIDTNANTARTITVELAELGELLAQAETELQGVTVKARTAGADGNDLRLRVTRALTFTPQTISLLNDLAAGDKSFIGPQFDWDTKIMTGDGQVPADAHRISFGDNENNIYVQYKKFEDGQYVYYFEPALKEEVRAGTVINFVTGSYTVELRDDSTALETYATVVTLYDLLNAIKTTSALLTVEGPVTYDRAAGGQALAELAFRTDAHYQQNSGFTEVSISATSPTELIEATCYAALPSEDERAGIGSELWTVKGSVSGLIAASVKTGEVISGPYFEGKIKAKLPPGVGVAANGRFAVEGISHVARVEEEITPEICPTSLTLGINAQETTLTLTYTARPAELDCPCSTNGPDLSSAECLGNIDPTTEGAPVPRYTDPQTLTRLKALYDWLADTVRENSEYVYLSNGTIVGIRQDPFLNGTIDAAYTANGKTLMSLVSSFERVLGYLDPLEAGSPKTAGYAAWSEAFTELQDDVEQHLGLADPETADAYENLAAGDAVCVFLDAGVRKIRKAVPSGIKYGFVAAASTAGNPATLLVEGTNSDIVSTEAAAAGSTFFYNPSYANPGQWVKTSDVPTVGDPAFLSDFTMTFVDATTGIKILASQDISGEALLGDRYLSRLKWALTEAELSPLGKFDADSEEAEDNCWQDLGDDYYWTVVGATGAYAPAFTNHPYYSARRGENNRYRGTKEFGFQINVTCPESLKVGDSITLVISNIPIREGYVKGDKVVLGVIGAGDLSFFGGKDGDNVQSWFVQDSVDGALPPYTLDLDAPAAYDSGTGIEFLISEGSIAFVKGDKFEFAIEGGHFRWRSIVAGAAGAWSAPAAITIAPMALEDGLSLSFALGESPAFFTGDVYEFLALQPYAASNVVLADFDRWNWGNENPAVAVFDLGASKTDIEAVALSFHTIPSTATILVEGSADNVTYDWDHEITWREHVMGLLLVAAETARYIRITITGAPDGAVGGLYVGPALRFTYSARMSINRQYQMQRGSGSNVVARHQGTGLGGIISWPEGALHEDDYADMVEMVDWLKEQHDQPLLIFPQHTRGAELVLAHIDSDNIEFNDVFSFQPNASADRRLSVALPLRGVAFL